MFMACRRGRWMTSCRPWAAPGIYKSQLSRLCEEIDERVDAFLTRLIEGEWLYLWIDATYLMVRQGGRIVSASVMIAVGVNTDGRREVEQMHPKLPKLATLINTSEEDVLAYMILTA